MVGWVFAETSVHEALGTAFAEFVDGSDGVDCLVVSSAGVEVFLYRWEEIFACFGVDWGGDVGAYPWVG